MIRVLNVLNGDLFQRKPITVETEDVYKGYKMRKRGDNVGVKALSCPWRRTLSCHSVCQELNHLIQFLGEKTISRLHTRKQHCSEEEFRRGGREK